MLSMGHRLNCFRVAYHFSLFLHWRQVDLSRLDRALVYSRFHLNMVSVHNDMRVFGFICLRSNMHLLLHCIRQDDLWLLFSDLAVSVVALRKLVRSGRPCHSLGVVPHGVLCQFSLPHILPIFLGKLIFNIGAFLIKVNLRWIFWMALLRRLRLVSSGVLRANVRSALFGCRLGVR